MLKLYLFITVFVIVCAQNERFELTILHYNDFHARFEETSPSGGACNPAFAPCIGGFARLATVVRQIIKQEPNTILLNGGDSFQGTLWYNLFKWRVTKDFMNMLPHDAHVLGNHEFDNGIDGAVPYLQNLDSTVVTANIIDDDEPTIQGLYEKSTIVIKNGKKIGIIGVIIATTDILSSPGRLRFKDEVESVREEAEKLHDQKVDIIVVLSHCGIELDRNIALHGGPHIDIIVGAHSHTLLYNGDVPVNSTFRPQGPYPEVVHQTESQRPVLIVQAGAHTAYLGDIKLTFDSDGNLVDWEGNPHYMSNDIPQDPEVIEKINEYLPLVDEMGSREIGHSLVQLTSSCSCSECNLGNLICDSYLHSVLNRTQNNNWHYAHFCIMNQGGIRVPISPGVISVASVIMTTPYDNRVEVFEMKGEHILEMLEFSAVNQPFAGARTLQTSGLHAKFDGSLPVNERVVEVSIRCIDCDIPRYEPLDLDKYYKVVSQSFLGNGGDGFSMIRDKRRNVEGIGIDNEILMEYISQQSPIFAESEGRMQNSNRC